MLAFRHPKGIAGRLGGMFMARANRRMARRAIGYLEVQPGDSVLEIGCGPGVGIQLLTGATSAAWMVGVDESDDMLAQARTRNAKAIGTGRVSLQQGSVDRLPFDGAAFDKALAIKAMQVWPNAVAGLREIRRVLRPEGRIALALTYRSGQTKQGLTDVLTTAGFADPRVVYANGEFYVLATKH